LKTSTHDIKTRFMSRFVLQVDYKRIL